MVLGQGSAAAMKQSRGTECIQAPEMLMAGEIKCFCLVLRFLIDSFSQVPSMPLQSTTVENPYHAASYSADVWSVGCLLYELLFGDFLFSDPDWTQFFVRVTKDVLPIASDSAAAAMAPYPLVSAFLSYILVRNSNMRPSISEVVSKFDSMFGHIMEMSSPVSLPVPVSVSETVAGASSWPVSVPSLLDRTVFFGHLFRFTFLATGVVICISVVGHRHLQQLLSIST
jgi:serine/threonine protein kinase